MPTLTCRDETHRYTIEVPDGDGYEIRLNVQGADLVMVPCPFEPGQTMALQDQFLIDAARDGDFGLRLLTETPLAGQDARPSGGTDAAAVNAPTEGHERP